MPNAYADRTLERQAAKLKDISTKYECDKRLWVDSIIELERKIKVNYIFTFHNWYNFS